jgi:hypothetical protein
MEDAGVIRAVEDPVWSKYSKQPKVAVFTVVTNALKCRSRLTVVSAVFHQFAQACSEGAASQQSRLAIAWQYGSAALIAGNRSPPLIQQLVGDLRFLN